ncbi:hypothetical protein D3C79_635260 [compost metagenome]
MDKQLPENQIIGKYQVARILPPLGQQVHHVFIGTVPRLVPFQRDEYQDQPVFKAVATPDICLVTCLGADDENPRLQCILVVEPQLAQRVDLF